MQLPTAATSSIRKWITLSCCLVLAAVSMNAQVAFEAEGTVRVTSYFPNAKTTNEAPFRVWVRDCAWRIKFEFPGDVVERGRDGGDIYSVHTQELDPLQLGESGFGGATTRETVFGGTVSDEVVPFGGLHGEVTLVWLALASRCAMPELAAQGRMAPPHLLTRPREDFAMETSLRDVAPGLLTRMVFFDPGYVEVGGRRQKYRPPFNLGFTNAIYQVTALKNLGALALPVAFEYSAFRPIRGGATTNALQVASYWVGTVTNLTAGCSLEKLAPDLPLGVDARIRDLRFHPEHRAFDYQSSRGFLSREEVVKLDGFKKWQSTHAPGPANPKPPAQRNLPPDRFLPATR